jgi:hypothetical protein
MGINWHIRYALLGFSTNLYLINDLIKFKLIKTEHLKIKVFGFN